jgi:hypothetical protein
MQYKSILSIYLMRLREYQQELAALPKLQYKNVLSYGSAFSFVLLTAGMYVYVDRDKARPWNV